jgi:hypothetical protein
MSSLISMTTLFHRIIFLYAIIRVYGRFGPGLDQFLGPPLTVAKLKQVQVDISKGVKPLELLLSSTPH